MSLILEHRREETKTCPIGFSWAVLFLGPFVPLYRGNWKWFIIMVIADVLTFGLTWLIFPFMYNKVYVKDLLRKGYSPSSRKDMIMLTVLNI